MKSITTLAAALILPLLAGCANGLPVTVASQDTPSGLLVSWAGERPGALPFHVIAGEDVSDVAITGLADDEATLTWTGVERFSLTLNVVYEDVDPGHPVAGTHALIAEPVIGRTVDGAWITERSLAEPDYEVDDEDLVFDYPFYTSNVVIRAGGLEAAADLGEDVRDRVRIEVHGGNDIIVESDGTFRLLSRELPDHWERVTGIAYPGELIFPVDR